MAKPLTKTRIVRHKEFYADGTLKAAGSYKGQHLHGRWRWYRKNGVIMRSGQFIDGIQVGEWITYDSNGQVYKRTVFKN